MHACPAPAGRPRFDIADIVRRHRGTLEAETHLSPAQRRVLSAIEICRTAALGGHLEVCRSCGDARSAYNSCRDRHCPKCQALAQERWIAARTERLLPARHFHVVFTLPSELRAVARARPREVFGALFASASRALLELFETHVGATPGITMVLHTWKRDLGFHPHVHALVTAGGLATDGSGWRKTAKAYLFPVRILGELLRGKMMDALRGMHACGELAAWTEDPEAFDQLMARLARARWVVYAKKPFRRHDHVLRYLGRYTHRVAIANSRIAAVTDDAVTFHTKNGRSETLRAVEFLRRFVQHVLPERFHKIRHFGLYAGVSVGVALEVARTALDPTAAATTPTNPAPAPSSWKENLRRLTGRDVDRCARCGGLVERLPLSRLPTLGRPSTHARAPPTSKVA
ncbi:MAG TPA: IS91 family transposase [Polyangiaceae bacterium]